jgi:hypothetical protein
MSVIEERPSFKFLTWSDIKLQVYSYLKRSVTFFNVVIFWDIAACSSYVTRQRYIKDDNMY